MSARSLVDSFPEVAKAAGFEIVERSEIGARAAQYAPIPPRLGRGVTELMAASFPRGLYTHQSEAIEAFLDGHDVCLSTSTASGKSLVFMAAAADVLLSDDSARVLALYPARALIQDQTDKWRSFLEPLNITSGFIDGSVSMDKRGEILRNSRVVLMTPDVAHAWLMSHLDDADISRLTSNLRLLILDEAHVYDGVFGTNMAYFIRRLQAVTSPHRLICSTATLGMPADFVQQLTGRHPKTFGPDDDSSASPPKTVLLLGEAGGNSFDNLVGLVMAIAQADMGRFLAFGDSRKLVEQVVAATRRPKDHQGEEPDVQQDADEGGHDEDEDEEEDEDEHTESGSPDDLPILPYRAGYESSDREGIQQALVAGRLAGVVSTSALELGLDIGDIDVIVLLNVPSSVKAFWQRLGRAGRKGPAVCLIVDSRRTIRDGAGGLQAYLERPLEPGWLYLENRYIQYANALCAALEMPAAGGLSEAAKHFETVPASFCEMLENEINPSEIVPPDLYPLKQRAQAGPHREFPIRSGVEQDFQVKGPIGVDLGNLSFPQALREAYPGAVYYYMARPYRVYRFDYRNGEILVKRARFSTTRPLAQAMVFPRFQGGVLTLMQSDTAFVAEVEMQVSERVLGFSEQRGSAKEEHRYGPGSPYSQRELNRFFQTTGVCWHFADRRGESEGAVMRIVEAFCSQFGIQERDLGRGPFFSKSSPLGSETCQGFCVFDATQGSLRLTQRLAENFGDVVDVAVKMARSQDDEAALNELLALGTRVEELRGVAATGGILLPSADGDWVEVIAPGEKAVFLGQEGAKEVEVLDFRYTPKGIMYELAHDPPDVKWTVPAATVQPLHGSTAMVRANLVTGDTEPIA